MNNETKTSIVDGVILSAEIIAAGTALYMLFGLSSKNTLTETKEWAINLEKEIASKIDANLNMSESAFQDIIDTVKTKYEKVKDII